MTGTPRLWRDGHREAAQELMDWLLATKLPNGWPVGPDFDVPLIEFAESATPKLSRTEAWRLLDLLSKVGGKSLDDLERLWNAGQGAANAEREWQFWLPLGLSLPQAGTALAFTLLGTRFAVEPASSVLISLAEDLKKQPEFRHYERDHAMPTMFVTFAARGEGWRGAWQVAGGAWDAFRGLAEFAFGRGQLRLMGEGPRARILHPSWLLARAPGEVIQLGQFSFDYEPERLPTGDFSISEAKVDHFRKLAVPLKEEPPKGSTLSIVADCLRLYAQAMDSGQAYGCFLGLWQLGEALTVADEHRGKTERVAARLSIFLKFRPVGSNRALEYLGWKRNAIVHRGIHNIDLEELNIVQVACEQALAWLLKEWNRLPTRLHLREFYRCFPLADGELTAIAETVAHLIEGRRFEKTQPTPEPPKPIPGDLRANIS